MIGASRPTFLQPGAQAIVVETCTSVPRLIRLAHEYRNGKPLKLRQIMRR